ncbi:right-handed parallel beta-helix repeat-containing protein [Candidatus Woesearchaeota archaeon]|nr:right-handed parallel beta-helix repeat-containing protein [Candidatus Woesearchaeota archaeon]
MWSECADISKPCSLSTANANAAAGDTIILRGGTYNTPIQPSHSGSGMNSRIIYQAFEGEKPVISQTGDIDTNFAAIWLNSNSYVKISGITVEHVGRWMLISRGSSYNEISYCEFKPPALISLRIYRTEGDACTNNWIHHNLIHEQGSVSSNWNDEGNLMQVGDPGYDGISGHNTIEDNVFWYGGHHTLETNTQFNVIRNNYMHNDCWMPDPSNPSVPRVQQPCTNGLYGNRCLSLGAQSGSLAATEGAFNLAEDNRFGHAGRPPDDDGADNVELASYRNIFRYNYIFNAAKDGLYLRDEAGGTIFGSYNQVYNNVVYLSGVNEAQDYNSIYRRTGIFLRTQCTGNVIKNNIAYANYNKDIYTGHPVALYGNTIENNWLTSVEKNDPLFITPGLVGDPKFRDTDVSYPFDIALPDLRLQPDSPCIDAGTHLTQASSPGSSSATITVDDAFYFQDGTWGSSLTHGVTLFPDWIAIGSVSNFVQIQSIDYSTNRITLASPMSWADNAPIWLYKKSDGEVVLYGSAPDIGAYEYAGTVSQPVAGDLNLDGVVDVADLVVVVGDFGKASGFNNPGSDTNADGVVDILDLVYVARKYTG